MEIKNRRNLTLFARLFESARFGNFAAKLYLDPMICTCLKKTKLSKLLDLKKLCGYSLPDAHFRANKAFWITIRYLMTSCREKKFLLCYSINNRPPPSLPSRRIPFMVGRVGGHIVVRRAS